MKSPSPTSSAFTLAAADVRLPAFSWRRAIAPLLVSAVVSTALTHSAVAHAAVTHAGSWPAQEKLVSVDIHAATRSVALDELADAAGWSLVVRDTAPPGAAIDLHIVKQAPGKVLDLILEDVPGSYTATRDGSIVSLSFSGGKSSGAATGSVAAVPSPLSSPAPPAAPSPPAPPASVDAGELAKLSEGHGRGDDRTVTGGSLRIEKNETVHNVSIFGGNLEVFGTVTGNVSVLGGSAHLHDGAHIEGSSNIIGGAVKIDDGVVIDGDVGVLGGSVKRAPGAIIHGSVEGLGDDDGDDDDEAADNVDHHDRAHDAHEEKTMHETEAEGVGFSVSAAALLFVFGALFLAFAPRRVELLRTELISRPIRSVVVGAVSSVALLVLVVMLVCTVLGIPVAVLLAVGAPVVMLLGACVILTTVGGALLQHRSTNPNVHLAAGCALFFLVGLIPVVGSIMRLALALAGLGIMVATRGAGLVARPSDTPPSSGMPYR
jgi:hypothetical protein